MSFPYAAAILLSLKVSLIAFQNFIVSVSEVCVWPHSPPILRSNLILDCPAAAHRLREPFIPSIIPHPPVKYGPRAADNTPHGWINPRGAFFP